MSFHSQYH